MSTPADVRARAARLVLQVAVEGRSLDALLANQSYGKPHERGLLRALSYGTIRWHIRLSAILEQMLSGPPERLAPEIRALSLVGLFQLLHTDIAPHAVVSETVNAARALGMPRAAGLLNALLRRCQREGADIATRIDADAALQSAHPAWLVEALRADWPAEAGNILAANNQHPPFWLRVNRQRCTTEDYAERLQAAGMQPTAHPFAPEALLLAEAVDVKSLPGFAEGWVSVQDAAAQLAARLVQPQPGQRVLDACAAPGGKTCHLLELAPGIGQLVAVDVAGERIARIRDNLERLGLEAEVITADAERPADWWDGQPFDRILLDVPCSATGVIRRHPDIKLLRRETDIPALAERQARLLERLWPLVKPGGRLVYASCSVLKAENTAVVRPFLDMHSEAIDVTAALAHAWPETEWRRAGDVGYRVRPGEAGMDGFYYACLQKSNG